MPGIYHWAGCCCKEHGAPCVDCTDPAKQTGATVTVAGSCSDETECHQVAGAYAFYGYNVNNCLDGGACCYEWRKVHPNCEPYPGTSKLQLWFDDLFGGRWCARIVGSTVCADYCFGYKKGCPFPPWATPVTGQVWCDKDSESITTGEGSFDLVGVNNVFHGDCTGCIATVTIP